MAIYTPNYLSPELTTIDSATPNTFSARVNGTKISKYQLLIYKMDNTLVYDSTVITLSPVLYDKDTIYITVPILSKNGYELKWLLNTWEETTSATYTSSRETPFYSYSTPIAVFNTIPSPVTTKSYTFTIAYSQAESIPLKKWKMILKDSNGNIIEDTDYSYKASISYEFDGLANGEIYTVESEIESQVGVVTNTGGYGFTVSYSAPSSNITANATLLESSSAIDVDWANAIQVLGNTTGTTSFVDNFVFSGNHGYEIKAPGTIYWDVNIPDEFTCTFWIALPTGFNGAFCQLDSTYELGYSGGRFYYSIDGIVEIFIPTTITGKVFLIAIRPTNIYIREFNI